jgi:hypothetical protein
MSTTDVNSPWQVHSSATACRRGSRACWCSHHTRFSSSSSSCLRSSGTCGSRWPRTARSCSCSRAPPTPTSSGSTPRCRWRRGSAATAGSRRRAYLWSPLRSTTTTEKVRRLSAYCAWRRCEAERRRGGCRRALTRSTSTASTCGSTRTPHARSSGATSCRRRRLLAKNCPTRRVHKRRPRRNCHRCSVHLVWGMCT